MVPSLATLARSERPHNAALGLGDYVRHRPEETLLYEIVHAHLSDFLDAVREHAPLPRYVASEFRKYLRCGILAHGFLRARCAGCGVDLLVAFSCKNRGVCPSCAARRMCATAAQIIDHVLPEVPVRQWVVTVPFELRMALATRATAMTAVLRIAEDEISRAYRRTAEARGIERPACGAITFVHRFGGSLNLHCHFHIVFIDGVFDGGTHRFEPLGAPSTAVQRTILARIHARVLRWARRNADVLGAEAPPDASGLEPAGVRRGLFAALDGQRQVEDAPDADEQRFEPRFQKTTAIRHEGFGLHAGVTVAASDRDGRERLCRYGARPAFSLAKLSRLDDGRIAYRVKYPRSRGRTHRVMTPLEFMASIAALIPPPRYPLVRYHGVLAPNAKLRSKVVPSFHRERAPACRLPAKPPRSAAPEVPCVAEREGTDRSERHPRETAPLAPVGGALPLVPSRNAGRRPDRRRMERIEWAELLRRVYDIDALHCPMCNGRLEFIALVMDRTAIAQVLDHLGESATGPPVARVLVAPA